MQSLAGGRHLLTTVVYRSNAFNRAIVCTFKEHIQDNINLIRGQGGKSSLKGLTKVDTIQSICDEPIGTLLIDSESKELSSYQV